MHGDLQERKVPDPKVRFEDGEEEESFGNNGDRKLNLVRNYYYYYYQSTLSSRAGVRPTSPLFSSRDCPCHGERTANNPRNEENELCPSGFRIPCEEPGKASRI